ncbi:hypothetical protein PUN28_014303 [Cardiocondyla obscurior]|uniref:Uncharacterized protein n=1 Tax=Cardiocondyla obscurior TaxID=286306 RepID=A0AAW2F3B8_9HYME
MLRQCVRGEIESRWRRRLSHYRPLLILNKDSATRVSILDKETLSRGRLRSSPLAITLPETLPAKRTREHDLPPSNDPFTSRQTRPKLNPRARFPHARRRGN